MIPYYFFPRKYAQTEVRGIFQEGIGTLRNKPYNGADLSKHRILLSSEITVNSQRCWYLRVLNERVIATCSCYSNHCQKFVHFYLFSHFELFLPTNTHSPNTCSHLHYVLTTCSPPFYFISLSPFTPSLNHCEYRRSQFGELSKTGAIYSQGSSPGT